MHLDEGIRAEYFGGWSEGRVLVKALSDKLFALLGHFFPSISIEGDLVVENVFLNYIISDIVERRKRIYDGIGKDTHSPNVHFCVSNLVLKYFGRAEFNIRFIGLNSIVGEAGCTLETLNLDSEVYNILATK